MRFATPLGSSTVWLATLVAATCAALVAIAQDATEIPTTTYVVREGDTCASIAGRLFGSRRRHDIIHSFNPNMGPPPHDLVPGTVLVLPVRAPDEASVPDARVTAVRRDVVSRTPSSEDWQHATRGDPLFRGYRVNARERSSAQLTFRDTSVVEIRANTLIVIYGGTPQATRITTGTATLERGTLRTRLGSLRMTVETPSASAELDGGSSVISTDESGSRVASHDGRSVRVRSASRRGAAVRLSPGYGSVVEPGAPPSPPRPLPPPPRATVDDPRVFAAVGGRGATITGSFEPVANAARYHVEILRAGNPPELIVGLDVPAEVDRYELRGLPVGDYRITVATIDASGLEGVPSEPVTRSVVGLGLSIPGESAARSPATGDSDPVEDSGWTVPPGTRVLVPDGLVCVGMDADRSIPLEVLGSIATDCSLADGTRLAPTSLEVALPPIALAPASHSTATIVRGVESTIALERTGYTESLPPSARFVATDGLRIVASDPDQGEVTVIADAATAETPAIALVIPDANGADVTIARLDLRVETPVVAARPVVAAAVSEDRVDTDVAGNLVDPFVLGARTMPTDDIEVSASVGVGGYAGESAVGTGRFDVSVRAHDRIRFDLGVLGALPVGRTPDDFGAMAVLVGVRGRLVDTDRADLVLSVDLAIPLHPSPTLDGPLVRTGLGSTIRLAPRFRLRPLAGVLLDSGSERGLRAAMLSVATDFLVDDTLSVGFLVDSRLGRFDDASHATLGAAGYLGFDYGSVVLTLFGRVEPFSANGRLSPVYSVGFAIRARARIE